LLSIGGLQYLDSFQVNTGAGPSSIATGYFNADGHIDVAVANEQEGTISILIGEGDGTLREANNFWANTAPVSLISADFNGDGRTDLAVGNGSAQTFTVLSGSGTGLFNTTKTYTTIGAADILSVGDLNGDGAVDLLVIDSIGAKLSTWLGH